MKKIFLLLILILFGSQVYAQGRKPCKNCKNYYQVTKDFIIFTEKQIEVMIKKGK